jgi:trehalose 6-phosphate phosphatase
MAEAIASSATDAGLTANAGRMVLELRPSLDLSKGTAVNDLVTTSDGLVGGSVLVAGDDLTDLDAFDAVRELQRSGAIARSVCVGIDSAEAPPELRSAVDLILPGPEDFALLLADLVA